MNQSEPDLLEQGYLVLRGAASQAQIAAAQAAFEAGWLPSDQWPVPRDPEWRLSQTDLDTSVQSICRLPSVLEAVGAMIGAPFFLMQIDGRDPLRGNQAQMLHRDAQGAEHPFAIAMVFLDDYGSHNGATRLVPGSHRGEDLAGPVILEGKAGDIVIMNANILHGATTNHSGEPRRSLLVTYADARLRAELARTERLRGVRMDTSEVFSVGS